MAIDGVLRLLGTGVCGKAYANVVLPADNFPHLSEIYSWAVYYISIRC